MGFALMRRGALGLGAAMALAGAALAAGPYDGEWDVDVIVESGECETGYQLPIKVSNGAVSYNGQVSTQAKGAISGGGKVTVHFVHDKNEVSGTGQLTARSGTGKWTSKTLKCTGRWQASKR